jgi:hypothetical protein
MKKIIIGFCFFLIVKTASAQKDQVTVPKKTIDKINEIVKPLKEQLNNLLEKDETGVYKAYQTDVAQIIEMKDDAEKQMATENIQKKYIDFFQKMWASIDVNEKEYQQQIRNAFPNGWGEMVEFGSFLNFIFKSSKKTSFPPKPSLPENKCIDVCPGAVGEIKGDPGIISSGGGSFGNCFLKAHGWSAVFGKNELYANLRNNITIPGTFPSDSRLLRVKKRYDLTQSVTSFALLGFGYAETRMQTYVSNEYMFVMSPVIFVASKYEAKTIWEEYLMPKTSIAQSLFRSYAGTFSVYLSGNWCLTECTNIQWSVCEEAN